MILTIQIYTSKKIQSKYIHLELRTYTLNLNHKLYLELILVQKLKAPQGLVLIMVQYTEIFHMVNARNDT